MRASLKYKEICGVMGGFGPEATSYLFNLIIKFRGAKKDQDHIPLLIFNNPEIPDRNNYLLGRGDNPLPGLVRTVKILKNAGATFIVSPCNTVHAYFPLLSKKTNMKFLNMISVTVSYIVKKYGNKIKIGLLATDGTVKTGIYHQEFQKTAPHIQILTPDVKGQENVMRAIYGKKGIKAGNCGEPNFTLLDNEAKKLMQKGAQLIIKGCTEIPLALPAEKCTYEVIDPMKILAKEILRKTLNSSRPGS